MGETSSALRPDLHRAHDPQTSFSRRNDMMSARYSTSKHSTRAPLDVQLSLPTSLQTHPRSMSRDPLPIQPARFLEAVSERGKAPTLMDFACTKCLWIQQKWQSIARQMLSDISWFPVRFPVASRAAPLHQPIPTTFLANLHYHLIFPTPKMASVYAPRFHLQQALCICLKHLC